MNRTNFERIENTKNSKTLEEQSKGRKFNKRNRRDERDVKRYQADRMAMETAIESPKVSNASHFNH